jgi:hypothetical protein
LNDRQDITEHEHKVWQKSSNIFTSFALKVRRQKRGNNFVPSSSAATAIGIKNFVRMKRGSLGRRNICGNFRKPPHVRLKRDRAADRG